MPVCLHCGALADEGALFCSKCGYTLPQSGAGGVAGGGPAPAVSGAGWNPPPPPPAATSPTPPPPPPPPPAWVPPPPAPTAPPPNGKYCVRCGTLIARAAVYCPVCQQPQGP